MMRVTTHTEGMPTMGQHVWIVQDRPSDEGQVRAAFTSKKSADDYAARIDRERGWGFGHETWVERIDLDPGLPIGQPDECPICGGALRVEWVESEDDVVRAGRWACQSNGEHFVEMKPGGQPHPVTEYWQPPRMPRM